MHSPRDGTSFAALADMSVADVDKAVDAAKAVANSEWANRDMADARAASLRALGDAIRRDKEALSVVETMDCGKTISESRVDMDACADLCDYYADITPAALAQETPIALPDADFASRVVASPVGVVAAVTPWNYPLMQAVVKVAPALAAGCPVVLKPSPLASLTCVKLGELVAADARFPEGALTVLTGGPPAGTDDAAAARLLSHPGVDYLSFTGSTRGGRDMLRSSAELVRPTGLELGGKGAMIVFDDAHVESVVDWAMVGIFATAGQICSATSRLLVHASAAAKVVEALHAATARVRLGDPLDEATQMGALISADAAARVLAHVERAQADGATLVAGGVRPPLDDGLADGYFVAPTLLTDVPLESGAWREEIFGPVLSVNTFETEAEAIALANDSPYGLAHAVMSADEERCERVAAALDAGTVWINASQPLWPQTPFGGWKASGFGKEWGEAGLHEYLRYKTITRTTAGSRFSWNAFA